MPLIEFEGLSGKGQPSPLAQEIANRSAWHGFDAQGLERPRSYRKNPTLVVNLQLRAIGRTVDDHLSQPTHTPPNAEFTRQVVRHMQDIRPMELVAGIPDFVEQIGHEHEANSRHAAHAGFIAQNHAVLLLREPFSDTAGMTRMAPDAIGLGQELGFPPTEIFNSDLLFLEMLMRTHDLPEYAVFKLDGITTYNPTRVRSADRELLRGSALLKGFTADKAVDVADIFQSGEGYEEMLGEDARRVRSHARTGLWTHLTAIWGSRRVHGLPPSIKDRFENDD